MSAQSRCWSVGMACDLAVRLGLALIFVASTETSAWTQQPDAALLYRAPEDGGVRRWRIAVDGGAPLFEAPSETAPTTAIAPDGAVLSNLGCLEDAGALWCEVRPILGGETSFARAADLAPAQGPDGATPMGVDDSKSRARRGDFDKHGDIACAQERGQALGACRAAIARSGGGDATVEVSFPNGFKRQLYFTHGAFISASATMSGVGRDTDWRLEGGLHLIRVDDQRYELPDALIFAE